MGGGQASQPKGRVIWRYSARAKRETVAGQQAKPRDIDGEDENVRASQTSHKRQKAIFAIV